MTGVDGDHLGSNEVISPFLPIMDALKTTEREKFAVVMDKKLLSIATQLQDQEKNPVLGDRYVLCAATDLETVKNLLESNLDLLDQGFQGRQSKMVGNRYFTALPIDDFIDAPVGVFVSILDISEEMAGLATRRSEMQGALRHLQMGIGIGTLVAVLLAWLVIGTITRSITRPLLKLVSLLKQVADRKDLTLRIDVNPKMKSGNSGEASTPFSKICSRFSAAWRIIRSRSARPRPKWPPCPTTWLREPRPCPFSPATPPNMGIRCAAAWKRPPGRLNN